MTQHSTAQHALERELKEYFKLQIDRDPAELDLTEISKDVIDIVRRYV